MEKAIFKPLPIKRQKFVKDWIESGNAVDAVRKNYDVTTEGSANSMAHKLTHDVDVLTEVRLALQNNGVSVNWIVEQHKKLVETSENDMVKTKNLEDLADYAGMKPKSGNKVELTPQGMTVQWGGEDV